MRLAKITDLRRRLTDRHKNAAPCFLRLKLNNLAGFADVDLAPQTGFLAICGGTGLGKSALLEAIRLATEPVTAGDPYGNDRIAGATVTLVVEHQGNQYERTNTGGVVAQTDDEGFPAGVAYVGLSERTTTLQTYFRDLDIDELKLTAQPIELDKADLSTLSAICRKEYSAARIYELEGVGDEVLPFIEATEAGASYDTRSMSTGELSAFYLSWVLARSEPYSIVLIEEPEAHLPPLSHEAVFALLCDYALSKRLGVVITTHSPTIASEIPQANLMSIRRQGGLSLLPTTGESKFKILSRLGLGPQKHAILFVEDELASTILSELLHIFEFNLICRSEIVNTNGGDGAVKVALEALPNNIKSVTFLGVLDGDVIDTAKKWPSASALVFLPFANQMEEELLGAIEARPAKSAQLLGRKSHQIEDALAHHAGLDAHDKFKSVATHLGVTTDAFARAALEIWSRKSGRRARMRRFARDLAAKVGIELPQSA